MQPTFFPWIGYFSLIKSVDTFVFLDDVEYSSQSWQTRNYFLISKQPSWITVPICSSSKTRLNEAQISALDRFLMKSQKTLIQAYAKSNKRYIIDDLFDFIRSQQVGNLSELNIAIIVYFSNYLELNQTFIKSSSLQSTKTKSDKVNEILTSLNAEKYISAPGSKQYMSEFGIDKFYCDVIFFDYNSSKSVSGYDDLGVNLSVLHSVMNYSKAEILNAI